MKPARGLRCAIYTRVSTDHGLDQEFNSLDAQREASEAYVKSQAHEGWQCLRDHFDDGGYSGGSMERPALQELISAVKARRLDIIVVYKVDRLTRSLADFAKLVELFDAHAVSFVSVTQSFNTTSSMGRLTLNVLLSFAQFEREVTGERIRDKIAASKKKGLWMGGIVPYGYRLDDRKLLVDPPEAGKVRLIFSLYRDLGSLPRLAQALAGQGIVSRPRVFASGQTVGGVAFRTGALSHLLGNRMYLGEINHRDRSYPGAHEPIIPEELFTAVQDLLRQRKNRRTDTTGQSHAPLRGLIFDDRGNRMTPVHASKASVRYRYYQSWVLGHGQREKAGTISRVAAGDIERVVGEAVGARFAIQTDAGQTLETQSMQMHDVISRVTIYPEHVAIVFKPASNRSEGDAERISRNAPDGDGEDATAAHPDRPEVLTIPWIKPAVTARRQVLALPGAPSSPQPLKAEARARILTGIAQGRHWLTLLTRGKVADIATLAKLHDRSEKSVRSILSLAFLAPDVVEAAIANRLPRRLGITRLTDLPADWTAQRHELGML